MPQKSDADHKSRAELPDVKLQKNEIKTLMQNYALPYRELMSYYRCAMMEVETKFNVLNEELSLQYDRNPIETIKTRLKSPESILEKLHRKNHPVTVDSIEQNLNDIAGVRVICAFPSDIYQLEEAFLKQDDIRLVERKDYIANPKSNGYRSLHLIVEIPIFLHDHKRLMRVEVQFRTISMDWICILTTALFSRSKNSTRMRSFSLGAMICRKDTAPYFLPMRKVRPSRNSKPPGAMKSLVESPEGGSQFQSKANLSSPSM